MKSCVLKSNHQFRSQSKFLLTRKSSSQYNWSLTKKCLFFTDRPHTTQVAQALWYVSPSISHGSSKLVIISPHFRHSPRERQKQSINSMDQWKILTEIFVNCWIILDRKSTFDFIEFDWWSINGFRWLRWIEIRNCHRILLITWWNNRRA